MESAKLSAEHLLASENSAGEKRKLLGLSVLPHKGKSVSLLPFVSELTLLAVYIYALKVKVAFLFWLRTPESSSRYIK